MNNSFDYQMTPKRSRAAELRRRGLEKLKPQWGIAILAFFLASLLFGTACVAAIGEDSGNVATGGVNLEMLFEDGDGDDAETIVGGVDLGRVTPAEFFGENGAWQAFWSEPILIGVGIGVVVGLLASLALHCFVGGPVTLGYNKIHLQLADRETPVIGTLFSYFKTTLLRSAGLRALHTLLTSIIPLLSLGIVAALGYLFMTWKWEELILLPTMEEFAFEFTIALAAVALILLPVLLLGAILNVFVMLRYAYCYMILAEYPEMGAVDALRNSARLMKGNKWRLFCLDLSFLGWAILCAFTCGIGSLFLGPYRSAAFTELYDEIANRSAAREVEFPSLNPEDYYPQDTL